MTDAQITQLAETILREMTPRGVEMARHYAHLEATQPHRPDAGNFLAALATSPTYRELRWIVEEVELAQIEVAVLKRVQVK